MSAFILTMFWIYLIVSVLALADLLVSDYPRIEKPRAVGFDCARLILNLAIVAWTAYLLWGRT